MTDTTGAGVYHGSGGAVITVTQNVTIYGAWDGSPAGTVVRNPEVYRTVLDGEMRRRGIYVDGVEATVDGLTIARGWAGPGILHANDGRGGIYVDAGALALSHSIITGNVSLSYGGGIYGNASVTLITACQVLSNSAQNGGGGVYQSGMVVTLQSSICRRNKASYGSALGTDKAFVSVLGNLITGGLGPNAVQVSSGPAFPAPSATNNVVAHNGGGFSVDNGPLRLTYNTIAGNGGTAVTSWSSAVTLTDNILAGSFGASTSAASGGTFSGSHNLFWQHGGGNPWTGSSPVLGDPLFFNPAADNYHLRTGSAAVDQGVAVPGILVDKDGWRRPIGAAPDIGAYERPRYAHLPLVLRN